MKNKIRYFFISGIGTLEKENRTANFSMTFQTKSGRFYNKKNVEDKILEFFGIKNPVITFFQEMKTQDYFNYISN